MSISLRILLGFGVTTLMMIGLGLFSLNEIGTLRDVTTTIVARDIAAYHQVDAVHDAQTEMAALRMAATNRAIRRQIGGLAAGNGDLDDSIAAWDHQAALTTGLLDTARHSVAEYAALARNPARKRSWSNVSVILGNLDGALRQIRADTQIAFAALRSGNDPAVLASDATLQNDRVGFDRLMSQAIDALNEGVRAGQDRTEQVYVESFWSIVAALLLAVAAALAVTALIRRSIAGPLAVFVDVTERVGAGDLSVRAPVRGAGEIGRLGAVINRMVDGLRQTAGQSREATGNLNVAVAEIRASTQQQAAGVEEQLAAVQETAATVDEIAHSGAQISRRAQDVIASAQATTRVSESGLRAVQESMRAMEQIQIQGEAVAANIVALSEKTQAIGEIVNSVNDISERSHLLALNAAIEAASAGEHGRSFSVVATEMKILADQAKDATTQVRAILGDIQRGINTSVMLTEEAVKRGAAGRERTQTAEATIEEMAAGIQDAVQTFQQIVASTNQQQLGIEQVMVALQNIRQASQQTAAGTRQLDSAALGLGALSRQLLATAERFRL